MRKNSILILVGIFWSVYGYSFGATLYVDNQLTSDCSTYDAAAGQGASACGTGSDFAYVKIQDAIDHMNIGDTVYIRGGTYHENNTYTEAMIDLPPSLNGDSWEEGHYNTLSSYPGEWAILDGQSNAPRGVVLGHKFMSTGHIKYWKIERLGITGGCSPGDDNEGGAAVWLAGGPFILRYCHIYDNYDDFWKNNPSGVTTYRLNNSRIEYNYFYHNGWSGTNGDQLTFFTDYDDEATGYNDLVDINEATRKNIIAYNLFDGGPEGSESGLKYKASQMLTDTDKTYTTYKEYGDKIHHNIFLNHNECSVILRQDFVQFYNNILVGPHGGLSWGQRSTWRRWYGVFYNNTIIDSGYWSYFDDSDQPFEANEYQVNTIYANYDAGSDQYSYPFLWWWDDTSHDSTNAVHEEVFDNNYIYNSISGDLFRVGVEITPHTDTHFGSFTVAEYNVENSVTNYQKASSEGTDNLFESDSGAGQYISRGAHVVSGSIAIANGGVGGSHPYLSGVTLPSYLGATNPDDHDWVAGVLALDATYMSQASGEPNWVEGSSSPSNTAPVAADDNATTDENLAVSIDVLANDSDVDTDTLTIDAFDTATANGGTIADNGAGTLIYTPAADWFGTDTFDYTISDGNGGNDSASVTITVNESSGSDGDGDGSSGCFIKAVAHGLF